MNEKINKPFYELYPSVNSAGIVIVDDIPVFSYLGERTEEGIRNGSVPINHILLQSGKHKVGAKLFPRYKKKSLTEEEGINIKFRLSDFDRWKETKHSFMPDLDSPPAYFDENNDMTSPLNGLPVFELGTEIEVDLPFKLDGWQNSVDFSKMDKDELKSQVFDYYSQLHAVLTSHNGSKFLELSKEKEDLQTQAFYFDEAKKEEIRQSVLSLFAENLEVLPLKENELNLNIWGYGKLVSLTRADGTQALQFIDKAGDEDLPVELEVKLHMRTKEKGLSII